MRRKYPGEKDTLTDEQIADLEKLRESLETYEPDPATEAVIRASATITPEQRRQVIGE
jgi:hypothetical protein